MHSKEKLTQVASPSALAYAESRMKDVSARRNVTPMQPVQIEVGLLTGGFDRPYAFGLAMALISKGVRLDVIGSDELDSPEMHTTPKLNFLNLQGSNGRPTSQRRYQGC